MEASAYLLLNISMKNNLDLSKLLTKEHEQKWVALSEDYEKVVDYSANLLELRKRIGDTQVVYLKVPESGKRYAF